MNKRGGISVVRVGLIAGGVGLLLIILGIASFYGEQASHRAPFDIDPFPGAEVWGFGQDNTAAGYQERFFKTPATPEEVMAYYQQKMVEHYGAGQEHCIRNPPTGSAPMLPDNPSSIPFQFTCLFDNSGIGTTQYTRILIYPGTPHEDPFRDSQGETVILYEQHWQS